MDQCAKQWAVSNKCMGCAPRVSTASAGNAAWAGVKCSCGQSWWQGGADAWQEWIPAVIRMLRSPIWAPGSTQRVQAGTKPGQAPPALSSSPCRGSSPPGSCDLVWLLYSAASLKGFCNQVAHKGSGFDVKNERTAEKDKIILLVQRGVCQKNSSRYTQALLPHSHFDFH